MALHDILSSSALDTTRLTLLLGGIVFVLLWRLSIIKLDPQEPPVLKSRIPIVGYAVEMAWEGHDFYRNTYKRAPVPIATLPMMSGKMYLIHSPELVLQMFKSRTLSFEPIVNSLMSALCGVSEAGMAIFANESFSPKWLKVIYTRMAGAPLQSLNLVAIDVILREVNSLGNVSEVKNIYTWLRMTLSRATIKSLMGEENPFNDQKVIDAYWKFDQHLAGLLGKYPKYTARTAWNARARQAAAYEAYFVKKLYLQPSTSDYIRDAFSLADEYGISDADKAGLNLAVVHGGLSNSAPTLMRHFDNIFTRPALMKRLREEATAVTSRTEEHGKIVMTLHISNLEQKVPLLVACFKETQRLSSEGSVNRLGPEDIHLSDGERTYLLKANTPIQCSGAHNHRSTEIWGNDALKFTPERWLQKQLQQQDANIKAAKSGGAQEESEVHRGKFFPFGGGKHLCPGRNFAMTEIWGLTIVLLLGFDITDANKQILKKPEYVTPPLTRGIARYKKGHDTRAVLTRKKGWEGVQWRVEP